jgi:hypothetical protein
MSPGSGGVLLGIRLRRFQQNWGNMELDLHDKHKMGCRRRKGEAFFEKLSLALILSTALDVLALFRNK